jgi:hypothetical protein
MTVVVAIACDDGSVVMSGDSFCGDEDIRNLCVAPKVYQVGPIGVGIRGMVRQEQCVEVVIRNAVAAEEEITEDWIKFVLPDKIRNAMKTVGASVEVEGMQQLKDSSYLIAFNGKIFFIEEDFGVWESRRPVAAIGSGRAFAYGAIDALLHTYQEPAYNWSDFKPDLDEALKAASLAMKAAENWCPWVCGPYETIVIPPPQE